MSFKCEGESGSKRERAQASVCVCVCLMHQTSDLVKQVLKKNKINIFY